MRLQQQRRVCSTASMVRSCRGGYFRCATTNGANSPEGARQKGEFEPGKLADFFTVDSNDLSIAAAIRETSPDIVFGMQPRPSPMLSWAENSWCAIIASAQQEILNQYQEVYRKVWSSAAAGDEINDVDNHRKYCNTRNDSRPRGSALHCKGWQQEAPSVA